MVALIRSISRANTLTVMDLSLTEDERDVLQEVLSAAFRDLRMEVGGTDNVHYRRGLQEREAILKSIVDRIGGLRDIE
jgi:hypothetical protein